MTAADHEYERRFAGTARLYGTENFALFERAHVVVVGAGGVGSWAIEALARSAIGRLTLIDMDVLVSSNVNRQLPAMSGTFGRGKIEVMAERARDINPRVQLTLVDDFLTRDNIERLLADTPDLVLDCTDDVDAKVSLCVYCRRRRIPLVVAGAAGGKTDPTLLRVDDLTRTHRDPLIAKVRRRLRRECNFPKDPAEKFGIYCVYSDQAVTTPEGAACEADLSCTGYGSATVVTASMGLLAVAEGLRHMLRRMKLREARAAGKSG
ncbi:MAG: tRNA threonylcarbamoyladenosine dehydratase [Moraxellaceae bacterium]|jgi:tRNA A37 threonylcarbamoyladenosine dehydratase|nr:tRNA threonylcarbamoyladenosine dehydratase [Moraxellaceae bacterium]